MFEAVPQKVGGSLYWNEHSCEGFSLLLLLLLPGAPHLYVFKVRVAVAPHLYYYYYSGGHTPECPPGPRQRSRGPTSLLLLLLGVTHPNVLQGHVREVEALRLYYYYYWGPHT